MFVLHFHVTDSDIYKMTTKYLEMPNRTEVLNKRLDLLRELLSVLQRQMERAHGVELEWIVIWLIVICVILDVVAIYHESLYSVMK